MNYEPAPDYQSKAYFTNFINVSPPEIERMNQRVIEQSNLIKNVIDVWKAKAGQTRVLVKKQEKIHRMTKKELNGLANILMQLREQIYLIQSFTSVIIHLKEYHFLWMDITILQLLLI